MKMPLMSLVILLAATMVLADEPAPIAWSGQSTSGTEVKVPAPDKPTVMAFLRGGQAQSRAAIEHLMTAVPEARAQVIVVVSGQDGATQAESLNGSLGRWPVVVDENYAASGAMDVHVWPTIVVVSPTGLVAGHLAGMSKSFAADLDAHLAYAAGEIDHAEMQKRLETRLVVTSAPAGAAQRHVIVAEQLLARNDITQAKAELESAIEMDPASTSARLLLAKVLLMANDPAGALGQIDRVPVEAAPAWQLAALRAAAFVAQERWDEARTLVPDALKLNPAPAEAHYIAGLIHQHDKEWPKAAEQFRLAYETRTGHGGK